MPTNSYLSFSWGLRVLGSSVSRRGDAGCSRIHPGSVARDCGQGLGFYVYPLVAHPERVNYSAVLSPIPVPSPSRQLWAKS